VKFPQFSWFPMKQLNLYSIRIIEWMNLLNTFHASETQTEVTETFFQQLSPQHPTFFATRKIRNNIWTIKKRGVSLCFCFRIRVLQFFMLVFLFWIGFLLVELISDLRTWVDIQGGANFFYKPERLQYILVNMFSRVLNSSTWLSRCSFSLGSKMNGK